MSAVPSGGGASCEVARHADHADPKGPGALSHLVTVCGSGSCPTLYATERGTYVVQGYVVPEAGVDVPAGESLVEIPAELLREAMRTLR